MNEATISGPRELLVMIPLGSSAWRARTVSILTIFKIVITAELLMHTDRVLIPFVVYLQFPMISCSSALSPPPSDLSSATLSQCGCFHVISSFC